LNTYGIALGKSRDVATQLLLFKLLNNLAHCLSLPRIN
jgi:hypothetical protein